MPEYSYEDTDEGIDDRHMVPLAALELAVEGGWPMRKFVEDLRGEHGEDAKAVADMFIGTGGFLLTPEFWMCLGRALGWSGTKEITLDGHERSHPRAIYEGIRWAENALAAKPEVRLERQEAFWTELLAARMSH